MRLLVKIAFVVVVAGFVVGPASAKSPGVSPFPALTIGPGNGSVLIFDWQINDAGPSATHPSAPGVAGPSADANGNVSGWSLIASEKINSPFLPHDVSSGNVNWTATATPGNQFDLQLETLLGPTTPFGVTTEGSMSDFDPTQRYVWPMISWMGTYTGPTDSATLTADTLFDTSNFANSLGTMPGAFSIVYNGSPVVLVGIPNVGSLDLVYTPVPEPGTLAFVGIAAGAAIGFGPRQFRRAKSV